MMYRGIPTFLIKIEFFFADIFAEDIYKNEMWVETQTLRCIIEGGGDVAFINTFHIDQYLGMYT